MSKVEGHEPTAEYLETNEPVSTEWSIHPGLVLKHEVLPERGVTASALADAIEVARPGLNNMLNGRRAITAPLALKIEAATGYPAAMMMKLQAAYDLAEAEHADGMTALVKKIAEMSQAMFEKTVVANDEVMSVIRRRA